MVAIEREEAILNLFFLAPARSTLQLLILAHVTVALRTAC